MLLVDHQDVTVTEPSRWVSVEVLMNQAADALRDADSGVEATHEDPFGRPLIELLRLVLGPPLDGALCKEMSPAEAERIFYPRPKVTIANLAVARHHCFTCPALRNCLKGSLEQNERHGIWAGTSRRMRIRIRVLIAAGQLTLDQVLDDFEAGRTDRYDQLHPNARESSSA